jgi:hypothetical protein
LVFFLCLTKIDVYIVTGRYTTLVSSLWRVRVSFSMKRRHLGFYWRTCDFPVWERVKHIVPVYNAHPSCKLKNLDKILRNINPKYGTKKREKWKQKLHLIRTNRNESFNWVSWKYIIQYTISNTSKDIPVHDLESHLTVYLINVSI